MLPPDNQCKGDGQRRDSQLCCERTITYTTKGFRSFDGHNVEKKHGTRELIKCIGRRIIHFESCVHCSDED